MLPDVPETTVDRLEGLDLSIVQPAKGYRFAVDALLLAFFASRFAGESLVDAGAGCGICSLALSRHSSTTRRATLFEIQPELAHCARENMRQNAPDHIKWTVRTEDARFALMPEAVDLLIANPPYRSPRSGRVSPVTQRALARHMYRMTPRALAAMAARILTPDGLACIIAPAASSIEWVQAFRSVQLPEAARCPVLSSADGTETFTMLALGHRPVPREMEPVILRDDRGNYTPTARFIMGIV